MQHIKINRESISVSAKELRVIRTLADSDYLAPLGWFEAGRGRNTRNEARDIAVEYTESPVGVRIFWRNTSQRIPAKVRKWFASHPRNQYVVAGNPRRIKAILAKIDSK